MVIKEGGGGGELQLRTRKGPSEKDVQLLRLAEKDDIETYLEGDG